MSWRFHCPSLDDLLLENLPGTTSAASPPTSLFWIRQLTWFRKRTQPGDRPNRFRSNFKPNYTTVVGGDSEMGPSLTCRGVCERTENRLLWTKASGRLVPQRRNCRDRRRLTSAGWSCWRGRGDNFQRKQITGQRTWTQFIVFQMEIVTDDSGHVTLSPDQRFLSDECSRRV